MRKYINIDSESIDDDSCGFIDIDSETEETPFADVASETEETLFVDVDSDTEETPFVDVDSDTEDTPFVDVASDTEETPFVDVASDTEETPFVDVASETEEASLVDVASETEEAPLVDVASDTEESLCAELVEELNQLSGYFQFKCMDAYMQAGCVLLVISLLTCPIAAGFLGITSVLGVTATAVLSTASLCVGSLSLVASFGMFSTRTNDDAERSEPRLDYSPVAS